MKMKKIFLLLCIAAIGCDSNDDGFYNTKYVNAADLVVLETLPEYQVNDVLFVSAEIPNLLDEAGQTTPLDVRQTTGNADKFDFSYLLQKETGDDVWEVVDVANDFVPDLGSHEVGAYVQGILDFDAMTQSYRFRGGVRLTEPGTYRLSYSLNSSAPDRVALRSRSPGNNVTLNIFSTSNALNSEGYYVFTVN